ncbi:MAG: 30S ribosomal protein S12 methylthiotransferase RimO [Alphaproteobacteria bacterium]|nr:30S ribosomal protein S12 methylthiotransferase RimO [Alphaproteobacteria bacterium]MCB9697770.1 30S ribosomal protein S12 methylthiotransferase RimO [Alphaproteobacteria bacterium]
MDTTTSSRPALPATTGEGRRVHVISLGCPKNRVDSELMVGQLLSDDHVLVDDPAQAEIIVVNTCSFIQPATEESIDTVLEMAGYKHTGRCEKLVVTGCMVQRYGRSLEGELPEVDHFLGTGEEHRLLEVLRGRDGSGPKSHVDVPLYLPDELAPRVNSWSSCSAYLKISEGCDHRCAFCIIPTLRGRLRSRTIPSLVAEARQLAEQGVVELNLVSQDSTAYGKDLAGGGNIGALLQALSEVDGIEWLRLHYAYPHGLPAGLLEQLAGNPKVCRYLDIPLQHASGPVLKAMRRGVTREGQERILERIRRHVPEISVRTTFIVGFPGETDGDFEVLCDFVKQQRFDHVGVFPYHQEDGTPAADLPGQVPEDVKVARRDELMKIQRSISRKRMRSLVGTTARVLIEGVSEESELLLRGRTSTQAPDVDGQVYVANAPEGLRPGSFLDVRITKAADYDLVAEPVEPQS